MIKVQWGSQEMTLAWSGAVSQRPNAIEIPSDLAVSSHLEAGMEVEVTILDPKTLYTAVRVSVEPVTIEDWEMLELNAGLVEAQIMNQVATVKKDTVVPIWINSSTVIRIAIKETVPAGNVKLADGTEVIVAPKPRATPKLSGPSEERRPPKLKKATLRVQQYIYGNTSTHLICDRSTMRQLNWRDGMLVTISNITPSLKHLERHNSSLRPSEHAPETPSAPSKNRKVVLRVFGDSLRSHHALLHINSATHLNLHLFSRFLATPLQNPVSEQLQRLLLKPLEWPSDPSKKDLPGKQELVDHLNTWMASNAGRVMRHSEETQQRPHTVPMINGSLISLGGIHYLAYCNIINARLPSDDEVKMSASEETRAVMGEMEGPRESPTSLQQIAQLMPHVPGMAALEQLNAMREAGNRVVQSRTDLKMRTSRQAAEYATRQEASESLFLIPYDAVFSDDTLDIGPSIADPTLVFPLDYFLPTHRPSHQLKPSSSSALALTAQSRASSASAVSTAHTEVPEFLVPAALSFLASPFKGIQTLSNTSLLVSTQDIGGLDTEISLSIDSVLTALGRNLLKDQLGIRCSGLILITGQHGSGKSMLSRALGNFASRNTSIAACPLQLNCSDFSGMKAKKAVDTLELLFSDAIFCQPSIVCLEDLDLAIPAENSDSPQASAAKAHYSQILACILKFIDSIYEMGHHIAIVATAQSTSALHSDIMHPKYILQQVPLPSPNMKSRIQILQKIVSRKGLLLCGDHGDPIEVNSPAAQSELSRVALRTDGYLGADLEQLVDRAVHAASVRLIQRQRAASHAFLMDSSFASASASASASAMNHTSHSHKLSNSIGADASIDDSNGADGSQTSESEDWSLPLPSAPRPGSTPIRLAVSAPLMLESQEGFVPISLRGVALSAATTHSWDDIGGLEELKRNLRETIEWPTKYGFLFKNSPIRHRSGILLFGPSGCGKTLVASTIAKECGLNFISVKGPELLNKYIGQSEQSVRDVFSRAQSASPCVLFFDEFDSIAPRRGHDNTGVTDRVVNQFLTELDGVEGLTGVYVLAATSRPDLIDPALLRPGRLDKSYYIGYPEEEERERILRALSRNMNLASDVQLSTVAQWSENCTGADLQALLYNSSLESIHERLEAAKEARKHGAKTDDSNHHRGQMLVLKYSPQRAVASNADNALEYATKPPASTTIALSAAARDAIIKKLDVVKQSLFEEAAQESSNSAEARPSEVAAGDAASITMAHLKKAFAALTPSSSPSERARNERTYSQFLNSKSTDFSDSQQAIAHQRSTLA